MKFCLPLVLLPLAAKAFVAPSCDVSSRPAFALHSTMVADDKTEVGESSVGVSAREARIAMPMSALLSGIALAAPSEAANAAAEYSGAATFQASLRQYFPGSIPNSQVAANVIKALGARGYKVAETLFGTSLCSDELNYTPQGLQALLQKGLTRQLGGGTFNLGGLAGMPYVGTSGFKAFFSHCPKEGKVVMMFGPHVGITQDGTVGKVERIGIKKPSTACGAAIGAYKALLKERNDGAKIPFGNPIDGQEEYIIKEMGKKIKNDSGLDSGAMTTITYRMYEIVWELMSSTLTEVITPGFWDDIVEITLLGGVVINQGVSKGSSEVLVEDYFQPVIFQSWVPKRGDFGFKIVDLYDEAFGEKNAAQEEMEEAAGVKVEAGEKE